MRDKDEKSVGGKPKFEENMSHNKNIELRYVDRKGNSCRNYDR